MVSRSLLVFFGLLHASMGWCPPHHPHEQLKQQQQQQQHPQETMTHQALSAFLAVALFICPLPAEARLPPMEDLLPLQEIVCLSEPRTTRRCDPIDTKFHPMETHFQIQPNATKVGSLGLPY